MPSVISLSDLAPARPPSPDDLTPPARFQAATFDSYLPQHPSQARALSRVERFVAAPSGRGQRRGLLGVFGRQRRPTARGGRADDVDGQPKGLYLDGGFGVGKTHLLAAAYAGSPVPDRRYLTFQQLAYLIGAMGMPAAVERFSRADLLCIDEFELDDPGNTLIVKSFLQSLFASGTSVVTTSNTPPEAQGAGRFNAEDFQREIQSMAADFEVVPVDGPDFRARHVGGSWLTREELDRLEAEEASPEPRLAVGWDELFDLLRALHPSRYAGVIEQVGTVYLRGARTVGDQNDALRFVHFIDQLYDRNVRFRASGDGAISGLFAPTYREGAYAKKHHRCESRLTELLAEPAQAVPPLAAAAAD